MKNILIVDDEDLLCYSLSAALMRNDTFVKIVSCCKKDALTEIGCNFYNLCFFDIRLPDADGLDMVKAVHEASPATKIIIMSIMTANEIDEDLMSDVQKNSWYFLPKPFELGNVRSLVDRASQYP